MILKKQNYAFLVLILLVPHRIAIEPEHLVGKKLY